MDHTSNELKENLIGQQTFGEIPKRNQMMIKIGFCAIAALAVMLSFLPEILPTNILTILYEHHLGVVSKILVAVPLRNPALHSFVEASSLPQEVVLFTFGVHCLVHFMFICWIGYWLISFEHSSGKEYTLKELAEVYDMKKIIERSQQKLPQDKQHLLKPTTGETFSLIFGFLVMCFITYENFFAKHSIESWKIVTPLAERYGRNRYLSWKLDQFCADALDNLATFGAWCSFEFEILLSVEFYFMAFICLLLFSKIYRQFSK